MKTSPGVRRSDPWRVLAVALLLLLLACPAGAVYAMDGVPLHTVAHGKHHGTVSVSGGHGLSPAPYSQSFTVPAGKVRFARLYVGVWGGNPEYRGTLETTFNGASLGTRPMDGEADRGAQVYVSGFGVHWSAYDVTSRVKNGANTATATTAGEQFDGRVYGMVLAVATEDTSAPEIEYWFAEGNENLNAAAGKNSASLALGAGPAPASVSGARLHVAYLASTRGDGDRLLFNGQTVATDAAGASSGGYFDVRSFDVTPLRRETATVGFARGSANRLHPAFAGYVATLASAPAPTTAPPATTAPPPAPASPLPTAAPPTATAPPALPSAAATVAATVVTTTLATSTTTATTVATAAVTTEAAEPTIPTASTPPTTSPPASASTVAQATVATGAASDAGPAVTAAGTSPGATADAATPAGGEVTTSAPGPTTNASALLPEAGDSGAAPAGEGALEALAGTGGGVTGPAIALFALVVAAGVLTFSALAGGGLYAYRRLARRERERGGRAPTAEPRTGRRYHDD